MYILAVFFSVLNVFFCARQFAVTRKIRDFSFVIWMLMTYFSLIFLWSIFKKGEFYEGFSGRHVHYTDADYFLVSAFVFFSNVFLFAGYLIGRNIFINRQIDFDIGRSNFLADVFSIIFLVIFIIGFILFISTAYSMDYTDFVEYRGSNWGLVFLYSSSSLLCLSYLRRRYFLCAICVSAYIYFAVTLWVRSFFIFSLFPIFFMYVADMKNREKLIGGTFRKPLVMIALMALIGLGGYISYLKTGEIRLPEDDLADFMIQVVSRISNGAPSTGFDSLERFIFGFVSPLSGVVGFSPELNQDVQVYFASLIFGYEFTDAYFHYPSLWYSDAYSSFGWGGVFFGLIWGVWFSGLESLLRKNKMVFSLFLPFYIWNFYMVFRGAVGNSIVSVIYPFYINLLIFIVVSVAFSLLVGGGRKRITRLFDR